MYKANKEHEQMKLFSDLDNLPINAKKKLENSWANSFYNEYFRSIDESVFKVLYSDIKSRPNTPVNILLGIEAIKSGFGWSDDTLYENFLFNIQIRYALGLYNLNEGYFNLRTLYNFRKALHDYEKENDINLVEKAFEKVTDEQIKRFEIKTGIQRMDSTLIQSNIRNMGRLQLLVECINRMYRILSEEDKNKYQGLFGQYTKEDSLHYCYRIKSNQSMEHLEQIGNDIKEILEVLNNDYKNTKEYMHLNRVFVEHYKIEEEKIITKKNEELKGSNLQSPDDEKATYRKKGRDRAKGCVSNISETCDKENSLQLITKASTESNTTDDQELYANDVKNLKNRTNLDTIWTDGGYVGDKADQASKKNNITHNVTAVKGKNKSTDKMSLDDFIFKRYNNGNICEIECPNEVKGKIENGRKKGRMIARFEITKCKDCLFKDKCPTTEAKKKPMRILRFSIKEAIVSEKRKQVENHGTDRNIRASVESTIRSVIHPFGGHLCKMPVRGIFRIASMIILSAAMVNIKRIHKYQLKINTLSSNLSIFIRNFIERINYYKIGLNFDYFRIF